MAQILKRRREGKTDYKLRMSLLKSENPRIVYRRSNKYITGQCVESKEAKDKVICGVDSRKLLEFGWDKKAVGSLKSIPASYLTGFLLGKIMLDKGKSEGIYDIGLTKEEKKSRVFSFLKGIVDSGVKINSGKEIFPEKERINGKGMKNKVDVNKVKENIEKKYK